MSVHTKCQYQVTVSGTDPVLEIGHILRHLNAVTFLFITLESWLTPHCKGIFMDFPTKQILIIFDEFLIFVKAPTISYTASPTMCGIESTVIFTYKSFPHQVHELHQIVFKSHSIWIASTNCGSPKHLMYIDCVLVNHGRSILCFNW